MKEDGQLLLHYSFAHAMQFFKLQHDYDIDTNPYVAKQFLHVINESHSAHYKEHGKQRFGDSYVRKKFICVFFPH